MSPTNTDGLRRAETLIELKRYDEAIALLGPIVATRPEESAPHILLARALVLTDRAAEALPLAERGCALDAASPYPQRIRCDVLLALKRNGEALDVAWWSVHLAPENPHCHWAVERCAVAKGDGTLALQAAQNVAQFDHGGAFAHHALGYALLARKQWSRAEEEYRQALALAPNDPTLMNNLGKALLSQGRSAEATELFLRAGEIDSTSDLYMRNTAVAARAHTFGGLPGRLQASLGGPGGRGLRILVIFGGFLFVSTLVRSTIGIAVLAVIGGGMIALAFARRRHLDQRARQAIRIDRMRRRERGGADRPTSWGLIAKIALVATVLIFAIGFLLDALTR